MWIGETVRIRSSLKVGSYEGQSKDGRARVKYHQKILLVKYSNLEEYKIPINKTIPVFMDMNDDKPSVKKSSSFVNQIDLHIDILNPSLEHSAPQMILSHQILKCEEFIEEAIRLQIKIITIIHGKGTGQLKLEVDNIISHYNEVRYTLPKHNGGATEVWLK